MSGAPLTEDDRVYLAASFDLAHKARIENQLSVPISWMASSLPGFPAASPTVRACGFEILRLASRSTSSTERGCQ